MTYNNYKFEFNQHFDWCEKIESSLEVVLPFSQETKEVLDEILGVWKTSEKIKQASF